MSATRSNIIQDKSKPVDTSFHQHGATLLAAPNSNIASGREKAAAICFIIATAGR